MKRVLFVCTGNVFRSLSAEKCLQKYLSDNNITDLKVDSAGMSKNIGKKEEPVDSATKEQLKSYGIKVVNHKRRKITKKDIEDNDVIIAIAHNHKEYVQKNFSITVPLFNELIGKGKTDIVDVCDAVENWRENRVQSEKYMKKIVKYIHGNIPKIYKTILNL